MDLNLFFLIYHSEGKRPPLLDTSNSLSIGPCWLEM